MIYFPHLEFVHAVRLANKATRRGDAKAAAHWLRIAGEHMKLYHAYNTGQDEADERHDASVRNAATLPSMRVRWITDPPDAAANTKWSPGR